MAVSVKTMNAKKSEKAMTGTARKGEPYLSQLKSEFKKITWTDREQLLVYTKIVVGATFFFGIGIYTVDVLIRSVLSALELIGRTFFG